MKMYNEIEIDTIDEEEAYKKEVKRKGNYQLEKINIAQKKKRRAYKSHRKDKLSERDFEL